MKKLILFTSLLSAISSVGLLATDAYAEEQARPVSLVAQRVERLILLRDCKITRDQEPKGDLTYRVRGHDGIHTFVRPIYSDLCTLPTQQFITRIYFQLSSSPMSPIIGVVGGNEDGAELGFPLFSGQVLKRN